MSSVRSFIAAFGAMASVFAIASCGGSPSEAGSGGTSGAPATSNGGRAGGEEPMLDLGDSGSGGDDGSGGDNGFGGKAPAACASTTAKAEIVPANLLFVLDKSGSMECNPPDGDAERAELCASFPKKQDPELPSKWEVTKAALEQALDVLVDAPNVSAGLMLFPREGECGVSSEPSVPIAPLDAAHTAEIVEALGAVTPAGETPVAGATILSYAHLSERLRAGTLSGNSFVILLTDGVETCAPSVLGPLVEKNVPDARVGFDIRTFVIGAPGSEAARPLLSTLAWEGGTAANETCEHDPESAGGDCHLDMTATDDFEAELRGALEAIANSEAISCDIAVPQNPKGGGVDLNKVNVTFTPEGGESQRIGNDSAPCTEANGWQYSEDSTKIVLCGAACETLKRETGELSIELGCPTEKVR